MDRDKQRVRTTLKICGIVAATAVVVSIAIPTAVGAAGQLVTLVDSDSTSQAQIDNGSVRIGGTVNARPAVLSEYRRFSAGMFEGSTCTALATPPAGKAFVITNMSVNTFFNPSPGAADRVGFYVGTSCSGMVADVNPSGIGLTNVDLGPGLTVPNGQSLFIDHDGENRSEIFAFGYQVFGSNVPAAAEPSGDSMSPQQQLNG